MSDTDQEERAFAAQLFGGTRTSAKPPPNPAPPAQGNVVRSEGQTVSRPKPENADATTFVRELFHGYPDWW